jgi:hypothetical protein
MLQNEPSHLTKLRLSLPWLVKYPFERARAFLETTAFEKKHVIITVANHFEPGWTPKGGFLDKKTQLARLKEYRVRFMKEAGSVVDVDGTHFRHTNFYPAEQYDRDLLDIMSEMQAEGYGEVEVHMHHEGDGPDTPENVERTLVTFRDVLAERHSCLSRMDGNGMPMYAFVHGNLALANSCGGKFCGVDNEMQILQETGCYADMTLPSAPDESQVSVLNQIYECGNPLDEAVPHRSGVRVKANGRKPTLPLIFTGPLMVNWLRRSGPWPFPGIDGGQLAANEPMDMARFRRWSAANVTVEGRSDWIFIKLYCHGFFDYDQKATIGDDAQRFFGELVEQSTKRAHHQIHFASAREAFNMVLAAIDGKGGNPNQYRDYRLRSIMEQGAPVEVASVIRST